MVPTKIIAHLDSMHPTRTTHQSKNATIIGEGSNHLENLNIETLKKLFDPSFIRLNFLRTFLTVNDVYLNGRLKWAAQRGRTVSKTLIWLKLRQRLYRAFGPSTNLIHIRL